MLHASKYVVNTAFFQIRLRPIANCEEWTVSYVVTILSYVFTTITCYVRSYVYTPVYRNMQANNITVIVFSVYS